MGFEVILQGGVGIDDEGILDESGLIVKRLLDSKEIETLLARINRTTVKKRILCKGRQLVRVDLETVCEALNPIIDEKVDVIVVSDYAKGVVGENTVKTLKENYDVPIIINGKPKNVRYYMGADVVVFNKKEANEVLDYLRSIYNPDPTYADIAGYFNILYVVVTKGDEGIEAYDGSELRYTVEARKVDVKDITGAGDTVTAALALELANSGDMGKAIALANFAGGVKVTKDKTSEVSYQELTLEEINPEDAGRESTERLIERFEHTPSD
jgi:D-beta-D-heptose 7-phosphate kinase/D-beta-D-heptose 1-phosphate adenosyltransferase